MFNLKIMREALVVSCLSGVLFASGCSHDELQPFCEEAIVPEVATYPDCLSVEEALEALFRFQNDDEASTRSDQPAVADVEVLMRSDVSAATRSAEGNRPLAYIARFEGDGYAILNATAHYAPVVAYVPKGSLTVAEMVAAKEATDRGEDAETPTYIHARVVDYLLAAAENDAPMPEQSADTKASLWPMEPIEPTLLQVEWSQWAPFNGDCPYINGVQAPVGCVALALGQVLIYNKAMHDVGPTYIKDYVNPSKKYTAQWEILTKSIMSKTPPAECWFQLSKFLHYIGLAVNMDYTKGDESTTTPSKVVEFLKKQAGYKNVTLRNPMIEDIKSMLNAFHPVYARGTATIVDEQYNIKIGGAHAWVIDGWKQKKEIFTTPGDPAIFYYDYLYCHYGYGGKYDGWYLFDNNTLKNANYLLANIIYYTL